MSKRVANYVIDEKLDKLFKELRGFQRQYTVDMHGDSKINGNKGIIGNLREMKDYPSITWLLVHKPKKTIGAIMVAFAIIQVLLIGGLVLAIVKLWL